MITLAALAELVAEHGADLDHPVAPFRVGEVVHDTDAQPLLMGVVNLSQDSWYRESVAAGRADAVRRGRVLVAQGAGLVDVGAESVADAAERVGAARQREQLVPVVEELTAAGVPVSVESYHPDVVAACLAAGAQVLNLTGSVDDAAMFELAAAHRASVVLCHVGGDHPRDLREERAPVDADPVPEILEQLQQRTAHARDLGVDSVAIDPGLGFGLTWVRDPAERARYQAAMLLQTFRMRRAGVPLCHALPSAIGVFGEQVRTAEGFFAVLATLGRTGILRTHEVPRVRAVVDAMATFDPRLPRPAQAAVRPVDPGPSSA